MEVVDAAIFLKVLEEGVDEVGVLQYGGQVHVETRGLGLTVISDKPVIEIYCCLSNRIEVIRQSYPRRSLTGGSGHEG